MLTRRQLLKGAVLGIIALHPTTRAFAKRPLAQETIPNDQSRFPTAELYDVDYDRWGLSSDPRIGLIAGAYDEAFFLLNTRFRVGLGLGRTLSEIEKELDFITHRSGLTGGCFLTSPEPVLPNQLRAGFSTSHPPPLFQNLDIFWSSLRTFKPNFEGTWPQCDRVSGTPLWPEDLGFLLSLGAQPLLLTGIYAALKKAAVTHAQTRPAIKLLREADALGTKADLGFLLSIFCSTQSDPLDTLSWNSLTHNEWKPLIAKLPRFLRSPTLSKRSLLARLSPLLVREYIGDRGGKDAETPSSCTNNNGSIPPETLNEIMAFCRRLDLSADCTILYPAAGFDMSGVHLAAALLDNDLAPQARIIMTDIRGAQLRRFRTGLQQLVNEDKIVELKEECLEVPYGWEVQFNLRYKTPRGQKPISIVYALRRSGELLYRQSYLDQADILLCHDSLGPHRNLRDFLLASKRTTTPRNRLFVSEQIFSDQWSLPGAVRFVGGYNGCNCFDLATYHRKADTAHAVAYIADTSWLNETPENKLVRQVWGIATD